MTELDDAEYVRGLHVRKKYYDTIARRLATGCQPVSAPEDIADEVLAAFPNSKLTREECTKHLKSVRC